MQAQTTPHSGRNVGLWRAVRRLGGDTDSFRDVAIFPAPRLSVVVWLVHVAANVPHILIQGL